jgi:hypothetical protein
MAINTLEEADQFFINPLVEIFLSGFPLKDIDSYAYKLWRHGQCFKLATDECQCCKGAAQECLVTCR